MSGGGSSDDEVVFEVPALDTAIDDVLRVSAPVICTSISTTVLNGEIMGLDRLTNGKVLLVTASGQSTLGPLCHAFFTPSTDRTAARRSVISVCCFSSRSMT